MKKYSAFVVLVPVAIVLIAVFEWAGLFWVLGFSSVITAVRVASRYERTPRSGG